MEAIPDHLPSCILTYEQIPKASQLPTTIIEMLRYHDENWNIKILDYQCISSASRQRSSISTSEKKEIQLLVHLILHPLES